jgi:uncharacterized phiE125 gp8 family phage protein
LSLSEAKAHLRVDISDEDASILGYVKTARRNLEWKYARALVQQTLVLGLDEFPWQTGPWLPAYQTRGVIELRPPVQTLTSITYVDSAGATQTMSALNYRLEKDSEPGRVTPVIGQVWPATAALPNAVLVEYVSGAASADLVPDDIKQAVRLLLGHYYLNREQVVTDTRVMSVELARSVDDLMAPYAPVLVA